MKCVSFLIALVALFLVMRVASFITESPETDPILNEFQISRSASSARTASIVLASTRERSLFPARNGPVSTEPLRKVLEKTGKFKILLEILDKAAILTTLEAAQNQTIIAPTDYAFRMSARDIGCSRHDDDDDVIDCFTGGLPSDFGGVPFVWEYHMLNGSRPLSEMLFNHVFVMSNGVQVYRKGIFFVDQVPWLPNARLKVDLYDVAYNGGFVHSVHRVMLPFTSTSPADPCDLFEYPFTVADGTFARIYRLVKAVAKCDTMQQAVSTCAVDASDVCASGRGAQPVTGDITIGLTVAAAKKCTSVFDALKACGWTDLLV